MSLNTNITNLQEILDKVNNLPSSEPQENLEEELNTQSALISEQNAKIAELAEVLANKASGSSGQDIKYDTCTVSINPLGGKLFGYCFNCFDGEKVLQKYDFSNDDLGSVIITDVICGSTFSIISIVTNVSLFTTNVTTVGSLNQRGGIFIAPTQPGSIATIQIGADFVGGGE